MTNEELRIALLDVAHRLTMIATGEDVSVPLAFPPGTIPVKPDGVLGQGKIRFWPEPKEVPRMDGTAGMELCWSYALRMSYVKGPDGEPLVPAIYRQGIGEWMIKAAPSPEQWRLYPAAVDRCGYSPTLSGRKTTGASTASDALGTADAGGVAGHQRPVLAAASAYGLSVSPSRAWLCNTGSGSVTLLT
jgi:hypothetical protein